MLDERNGSLEVVDFGGLLDPVEIDSLEGDIRYVGAHLFIINPRVLHNSFELFGLIPLYKAGMEQICINKKKGV